MVLQPLASAADLNTRGIDTSNTPRVEAFLASASTAVRTAAGSPIGQTTSTVTVPGTTGRWLRLPGGPVTDVTTVTLDGQTVTGWRLAGNRLWRGCGWAGQASTVTVTYTHGLPQVPADIVDLVCSLVGLALSRAADGDYAARGDTTRLAIDDYAESFASGDDAQTGPFDLPARTRDMLRTRFGGNGWST